MREIKLKVNASKFENIQKLNDQFTKVVGYLKREKEECEAIFGFNRVEDGYGVDDTQPILTLKFHVPMEIVRDLDVVDAEEIKDV